jgi:hypothetical protein
MENFDQSTLQCHHYEKFYGFQPYKSNDMGRHLFSMDVAYFESNEPLLLKFVCDHYRCPSVMCV